MIRQALIGVIVFTLSVRQCSLAAADPFFCEPVPSVAVMDIPGLKLRAPEYVSACALRFGKGAKEILYLVFDCAAEFERHDVVYAYSPGSTVYGKPKMFRGRNEKDCIRFRPLRIQGNYGDLRVDYDIGFTCQSQWEKPRVDVDFEIDCRLVNRKTLKRCSFSLVSTVIARVQARTPVEKTYLLQAPSLRVGWDYRSSPPHIRSRILMGRHAMITGSGLTSRATVLVREEDGHVRERRKIKMDFAPTGDFVHKPQKRLRDATPYAAEVEIDLGKLFGVVKGKAKTVLR